MLRLFGIRKLMMGRVEVYINRDLSSWSYTRGLNCIYLGLGHSM